MDAIKQGKGRTTVLWIIAILCGSFFFLDWSQFLVKWPNAVDTYVRSAKLTVSLLCTLLVLLGWQSKRNKNDAGILLWAFIAINLGDFAFFAKVIGLSSAIFPSVGVGIFLVAQLLFILRAFPNLKIIDFRNSAKYRFSIFSGILMCALALGMIGTLWHISKAREILISVPLVVLYALIVGISTWVGLQTRVGTYYPRSVAKQISLGMLLFFCCDCTVGLGKVLSGTQAGMIASSLTWIFYAPALVLLALSVADPSHEA